MWTKWLPWRYIISRFARSHGFLDPITLLARLHGFAQPSEVAEPIELLRAGVVFHARGLINSRAIQHNLDWVWPFWVERQFDPHDEAFVPRAFSITHVNLTHRNWTAVGIPDCEPLPIVDPRGLVTPLYDGWSIDAWIIPHEGTPLLPSRAAEAHQRLVLGDRLHVATEVGQDGHRLQSRVEVQRTSGGLECQVHLTGQGARDGWLAVALRPVNPEGISFIHEATVTDGLQQIMVDGAGSVLLEQKPERVIASWYRRGDVLQDLLPQSVRSAELADRAAGRQTRDPSLVVQPFEFTQRGGSVTCDVGLATIAALYPLKAQQPLEALVRIPLPESGKIDSFGRSARRATQAALRQPTASRAGETSPPADWTRETIGDCQLAIPDAWMQFLFEAAVRNLVLHAPNDIYPGPYTYKRFWFRDAAFLLYGLLKLGLFDRAERVLSRFPERQTRAGYFRSQEGEWDSNGEAIWIFDRYRRMSGRELPASWIDSIEAGAHWIAGKRVSDQLDAPHAGLLPAGFSAEHLGPNDFYYWDDFWSIAGLHSAADILRKAGRAAAAERAEAEAGALAAAIERSLQCSAGHRDRPGIPASPYRRMDAGAIGSLVVGYPLQLWSPQDARLMATVNFLLENCLVHGGFFQDMIHSGINAYLTLHLAQVLLRARDPRYWSLIQCVAQLASSTGQWPEAIHPRTGGGCMGDGQHIWAAAEWIVMLCHLFVREEEDRLILADGIPGEWLETQQPMRLGPTATLFGTVDVEVLPERDQVTVRWSGDWRVRPTCVEIRLPGYQAMLRQPEDREAVLVPLSSVRRSEIRP